MLASTPLTITGSDQQIFAGPATYAGAVLRETGSAAAEVRVYDGTDNTGKLIDVVILTADGAASSEARLVRAQDGIFMEVVSGAVAGSVFVL